MKWTKWGSKGFKLKNGWKGKVIITLEPWMGLKNRLVDILLMKLRPSSFS